MNQQFHFEQYPIRIVVVTNLVSVLIYLTGFYIIYQLGLIWALVYLAYILFLEVRLLRNSCPDCYYYGKLCAFSKGWISSVFFKKGNPEKFACRPISWADMLPDLLVFLVPLVIGIIVLVVDFSWLLLFMTGILVLLATTGNGIIRGQMACKYCRQAELGCPALDLFNRSNKGV